MHNFDWMVILVRPYYFLPLPSLANFCVALERVEHKIEHANILARWG